MDNRKTISIENYDFKNEIKDYFDRIIEDKKGSKSFNDKLSNIKILNDYENIYTSFEKCPDNYVGEIDGVKYITAEDRYTARDSINQTGKKGDTNIVILLESPHKNEFQKKLTAPALGETGERLSLYLETLLKKEHIATAQSKLFLVNAIQYQCSLGFSTNCVRNHVFNYLFEKQEFKDDLKNRINIHFPKIIIIATTSFCREKIKKWILEEYNAQEFAIYEADSHPSVWTAKTKIVECK